jgi:hypothetical protein
LPSSCKARPGCRRHVYSVAPTEEFVGSGFSARQYDRSKGLTRVQVRA